MGDVPIEIREIRIKKGHRKFDEREGKIGRVSDCGCVTVSPKKKPVERKKKKKKGLLTQAEGSWVF